MSVRAAGRLHLGFLDPSATLGRRFGSLGVMIDGFETGLEVAAAELDSVQADTLGAQAELARVCACLQCLRQQTGRHAPLAVRLRSALPAHAGFGSGTQLALAVGRAFARWHALELPTAQLAHWLGRGQRSGIGIAGFDEGGLLVDGGPSASGAPAPLLARTALPEVWRIVVVVDPGFQGLSGAMERQAMATLAPLAQAQAADICHQVLMRVLPGAANDDFAAFAAGIKRVQELLAAHFAPAQDGSAWTSPAVGRLMQWLASASARQNPTAPAAIGQSSWGPTGFAFLPTAQAAEALLAEARAAGVVDAALQLHVVACRNHGAVVSSAARR